MKLFTQVKHRIPPVLLMNTEDHFDISNKEVYISTSEGVSFTMMQVDDIVNITKETTGETVCSISADNIDSLIEVISFGRIPFSFNGKVIISTFNSEIALLDDMAKYRLNKEDIPRG